MSVHTASVKSLQDARRPSTISQSEALIIYQNFAQLGPKLAELYNGPDPMFKNSASCPNCNTIAVEPSDCHGCKKIICKQCSRKSGAKCANCQSGLDGVDKLHPVMEEMYSRATFRCLYNCGMNRLSYKDFETHVLTQCKLRAIGCPNSCSSSPFKTWELGDHLKSCPKEPVKCPACKEKKVLRCDLAKHANTDCSARGENECEKCHAVYKADENHCCVSYLYKLIQQERNQTRENFVNVQNCLTAVDQRFTFQTEETNKLL